MQTKHLQRHQGSALGFSGTGHTINFLLGSGVPWNEPLTIVINNRHSARGKDTLQNMHLSFTGVSGQCILFDTVNEAGVSRYIFILPS